MNKHNGINWKSTAVAKLGKERAIWRKILNRHSTQFVASAKTQPVCNFSCLEKESPNTRTFIFTSFRKPENKQEGTQTLQKNTKKLQSCRSDLAALFCSLQAQIFTDGKSQSKLFNSTVLARRDMIIIV